MTVDSIIAPPNIEQGSHFFTFPKNAKGQNNTVNWFKVIGQYYRVRANVLQNMYRSDKSICRTDGGQDED